MSVDLFPHQLEAATFLAARRCALLADEPRVGKTRSAIHAVDLVGAKRVLVVVPAIARHDWALRFGQYASRAGREIFVVRSKRDAIPKAETACVVVVSYALMPVIGPGAGFFDVIIFDEGHYLKSSKSRRTKLALGKSGLVHRAKYVWFLTGTPAPNNPLELWPMLHIAGVYKKGYWSFVSEFCLGYRDRYGYHVTGVKNAPGLKKLLSGFMLRRGLDSVCPELPALSFYEYTAGRGGSPLPLPVWVEERFDSEPDPLVFLQQQVAPDSLAAWRHLSGLQKVASCVERVEYLRLPKLVIFAVHRSVIAALAEKLEAYRPAVVHGGIPPSSRDDAVRRFQTDGTCRVFIGQILAAGVAIDLSAADHAIILEATFTPGDSVQAANRLRNVLKLRPSFCEFFSDGGVDEKIQKILRRKAQDLASFLD